MSKKELVVKNPSDLTVSDMVADWGEAPALSSNDLVIPKILPQQGLSKFVTDGDARFGDFCNSITGEVLGSVSQPLEFIPFFMFKYWAINKKVVDKNGKADFVFTHMEPCTNENENLPWQYEIDGVEHSRQLNRAFYCLVKGQPLPLIVSFKGMSSKAGKILATQMYTINAVQKLPPSARVMTLIGKKEQNDKGTYIVLDVKVARDATKEEILESLQWFKTIKTTNVTFEHKDEEDLKVDVTNNKDF